MGDDTLIQVDHLTRVEGHGNITARIRGGEVEDVSFRVVEAVRFFELFLRGYRFPEVVHMASRICGICAVSHKNAALKATEAALGVEVFDQSVLLRRLAFHGEIISSHVLHVYFLALPDFLGAPSVFPLMKEYGDVINRGMGLKNFAYHLCSAVAGRHTHPVGMTVGGFSFVHDPKKLEAMRERLESAIEDIQSTVDLFRGLTLPRFERETEYVSLKHPSHYAFYEGALHSSENESVSPAEYRDVIREYTVPHSNAKYARWHRPHYMVGALARVNNSYDQLSPLAKKAAGELGLTVPCHNPFMIPIAQVVECAHCLEDSLIIIEELLQRGIRAEDEQAVVPVTPGRGVGAVEAPRGTLFHEYQYDEGGSCVDVNLVIPTGQNLANLEADMRAYVPGLHGQSRDELTLRLEMLARAYDPCISCSTHVIDLGPSANR